jgi:hypothetical protein
MDVFVFQTSPGTPTKLEHGEIINGIRSKMWVERYRENSEFEFIAPASSRIRDKLPIGSLISHVDTEEVMIVETHSISESKGERSDIVISGRSFETQLEQRVVGANKYFPNFPITDYVLAGQYTWIQAVDLIKDHIDPSIVVDPYDGLPYVAVVHDVSGVVGLALERSISRGDLYPRLLELLEVDNLGIKTIRPSGGSPNTILSIHSGEDRSDEVMFSHDSGEIESADYLWSNKLLKNSALVTGRWVELRVDNLSEVEYKRRTMFVDAKDIDEQYDELPTDPMILNSIYVKMEQRGQAALAAQRSIALTKAEVTQSGTRAKYRQDYDLGDLVTVHGDYHETSTRRVIEYVEIEDEQGMRSYPTLTADE